MELKEYKEVTEKRRVTIGYKCDVCGKAHYGNNYPNDWHEFSAHHNEWGKDSGDSYEYYLVCSPECYKIKLTSCINNFKEYESAEIDGMTVEFASKLLDNMR